MAIVENDPSARMQVRTRGGLMAPGACIVCGSGTCDDGYLDLDVFIEFHGTVYLCMTCVTQAGETIGMHTPEQFKITQDIAEGIARENDALKLELHNAREHIHSVNSLLQSQFLTSGTADSVIGGELQSEPQGDSDDVPDSPSGADGGESEVKESTPDIGRVRVSRVESRNLTG